ncbi:MAG: hypothetical protein AAFO95_20440 [Cyanobacteria bacterium J06600_6]
MSDILNCGQAKQKSELLRFSYQCPQSWENMQATENDSVRFCNACQESVFYCMSKQEAEQHTRQGNCVAIASELISNVKDELINKSVSSTWESVEELLAGMLEPQEANTVRVAKIVKDEVYED